MTDGITAKLSELIALQKHAHVASYHKDLRRAPSNGSHLSRLRGRGMDFTEVRNYQPGDEIRHVDWRVTARTGRPHIKLYQEERERPMVILVDYNPTMFFGTRCAFKSVVASRLAAILAWTAQTQGDRVGGLLFSAVSHNEFTPQNRSAGMMPFLSAISHYSESYDPRSMKMVKACVLSQALHRLRRIARPGSTLVLISDFYHMDDEVEQHLSRLRGHNDLLAYHICDHLELAPPSPGQYAMTNGLQDILLNTKDRIIREAYQRSCDERLEELQSQFRRQKIPYVQVLTDTDLPSLVRRTFPRRIGG